MRRGWIALAAVLLGVLGTAAGMSTAPPPVQDEFTARMEAEGREHIGTVRGHVNCWALVGPTSHLQCQDGYATES